MATTMGTPYSPPSPPDTSSSATMSPVYPDRPIRPLPRRSLRARLSPDIAEQITLPSAPQSNGSVFNNYKDAMVQRNGAQVANAIQEVDTVLPKIPGELELDSNGGYRFRGTTTESDEEQEMGLVHRLTDFPLGTVPVTVRGGMNGANRGPDHMSHSVASSNDSIDGYDSFENTNNKKKRKIPTSGSIGSHHAALPTSLSNELANMGISGARDIGNSLDGSGDGAGQYYGSGSSAVPVANPGTGISGAGRGRYGRSARRDASGRSPLGVSTGNTSNGWQAGRTSGPRRDYGSGGSVGKVTDAPTDHGIISAAIAEAAVLPTTPPKGRENVSLLDQTSSKRSPPTNSQFTFTCESDSSKNVIWPGDNPQSQHGSYSQAPEQTPSSHPPSNQRGFSTQGTQTSPTMADQHNQNAPPSASGQAPAQPLPKPRRSAAKRYAMAERQRKLQQQYSNYHHPPRDEDIWICEFCEYESIFGMPPIALIRQYEIKDSRERKRLAEKRRLLEKAKMKGRKGKKGNKNASKSNHATTQQQQQQQQSSGQHNHAQHTADTMAAPNHDTQSDEYYAEDYDDDPPEAAPTHHEVPSRIPRPIQTQSMQGPQVAQTNGT